MRSTIFFILLGITFCTAAQQNDNYIFRHIGQSDGLLHNVVSTLVQDKRGFIWIGTKNGLQRYDGSRFVNYKDELTSQYKTAVTVSNLSVDANNQLWFER